MNQAIDYHAILPELILAGTILLVLVVDVFLPAKRKSWSMIVGLIGTMAALIATLTLIGDGRTTFGGAYVVDNFAILFKIFFLSVAILVLGISYRYFREGGFYQGEYYFLLLTSFLGCVMMPSLARPAAAVHRARAGVGARVPDGGVPQERSQVQRGRPEVLPDRRAVDRGDALRHEPDLRAHGHHAAGRDRSGACRTSTPRRRRSRSAAILFVVIGFAFKVSAVPFQFWAPDTYEGAPVPVAAFLAVASSAAGFAGLLQLMFVGFIHQHAFWAPDLRGRSRSPP